MKKWKLFVVLTGFTLALSACQGGTSEKTSDAAPAAGQETTVQGEVSGEETADAAGEGNEDKAQESEAGEATSAANAEEIAVSNPMQEDRKPLLKSVFPWKCRRTWNLDSVLLSARLLPR